MFRKLENIREKILEKTLEIGATNGVGSISARTVATACDISTHTIYENFKSMTNLIDEIATNIRHQYLKFLATLIKNGKDYPTIFDAFIDKFIEEKNNTMFYTSYLHTLKVPKTLEYAEEILNASKSLFKDGLTDEELYLIWEYVRVSAFYYGRNIINGTIPNTPQIRKDIRKITLNGLEAFH